MQTHAGSSYGIAVYPPGASYGPRLGKDYEFVWLIEGTAEYHRDGYITTVPPGSVLLCKPGAEEFFQWDRKFRTSHAYLHFEVLDLSVRDQPINEWPLLQVLPDEDIFRPLFRFLLTWMESRSAALTDMTLTDLLQMFVFGHLTTARYDQKTWPHSVEEAYSFIARTLSEDPAARILPSIVAGEICVSQQHLNRLFTAATGYATSEVIRSVRLDHAASLLSRSNYSVGEVSEICGFANQFHFARLYRRAFAVTPSQTKSSGVRPQSRLLQHVR